MIREHVRESQVCIDLFYAFRAKYPQYADDLNHYPAGEHRHKSTAAKLKAMGTRAGRADYDLMIPVGQYHGLFLEIKPKLKGSPSEEQRSFLTSKRSLGYFGAVAFGANEAMEILTAYLECEHAKINWLQHCDMRGARKATIKRLERTWME